MTLTTVCFSSELCSGGWAWSKYSGTCIKDNADTIKTWTDARAVCKDHRADLVVIRNEEVNEFIHDMAQSVQGAFWIGLNDLKVEGEFKWLDSDEKTTYTKWLENQTDHAHPDDDCVQINNVYSRSTRSWTDDLCSNEKRIFCEKNQDTTGKCPAGWAWSPKSGTCIKIYVDKMSWRSAKETCRKHGADLLMILKEDMNTFLQEFLSPIDDYFWIGLNDLAVEGTYRWIDYADKVTYTKWATSPTFNGPVSKCTEVKDPQKGWEIVDCALKRKFICEKVSDHCNEHAEALCLRNCSRFCRDNVCNRRSGVCSFGCVSVYQQPLCNEKCADNTYGDYCAICSSNCGGPNKACNLRTGYCLHGCDEGFVGLFCSNKTYLNLIGVWDKRDNDSEFSAVAGVLLALLVLSFFVYLFFIIAQKKKRRQQDDQSKPTKDVDVEKTDYNDPEDKHETHYPSLDLRDAFGENQSDNLETENEPITEP